MAGAEGAEWLGEEGDSCGCRDVPGGGLTGPWLGFKEAGEEELGRALEAED